MFVDFFYTLRRSGVPVSPTSFLRLQKALNVGSSRGWMTSIQPLGPYWSKANAILISTTGCLRISFTVRNSPTFRGIDLDSTARELLEEWLKEPEALAQALGISREQLEGMSPEDLIKYFLERLKERNEAHHGGSRWIGTGGTSRSAVRDSIQEECG